MKFPTYSNLELVKAYGETWKLRYLFRGQILKAWMLVSFSSSNTILQHCFYVFIWRIFSISYTLCPNGCCSTVGSGTQKGYCPSIHVSAVLGHLYIRSLQGASDLVCGVGICPHSSNCLQCQQVTFISLEAIKPLPFFLHCYYLLC